MAIVKNIDPAVLAQLKKVFSAKYGGDIKKLKRILNERYQEQISNVSGDLISEKTLDDFFSGRKISTNEKNLNYFCGALLDYPSYVEAIDGLNAPSQSEPQLKSGKELQKCLTALRNKTLKRCEHIQVLDKPNALKTKAIYTDAYLYDLSDRRKEDYMAVMQDISLNISGQPSQKSLIESLDVVKKHERLLILGRPGAGKTAFLKYLALYYLESLPNCIENFGKELHLLYLPLRVVGKHIVNFGMIDWLIHDLAEGSANAEVTMLDLKAMFRQGQFMILLDALDETAELFDDVCKRLEEFVLDYPDNRIIITSRLSTYYPNLDGFKSFELSGFNKSQIESYCVKWFQKESHEESQSPDQAMEQDEHSSEELTEDFLKRLKQNRLAYEMADNPLSLTYLCMLYKGNYGFAKCQAEIFKDVADIFLRKWDEARNIRGRIPNTSDKLSRHRKFTMFSQLAYEGLTKEASKYIWKEREIKNWLYGFLKNLSTYQDIAYQDNDPESTIRNDAEILLKVAVMDDGLLVPATMGNYAFPYVSMQEYFVAEHLLQNSDLRQEVISQRLFDKQWETVFLMLTELIPNADTLFKEMFKQIQRFALNHPQIASLLGWLNEVSTDFGIPTSSWRSQIIFLDIATDLYISRQTPVEDIYALELSKDFKIYNEKRDKKLDNQPKLVISLYLAIAHALVEDKIKSGEENYKKLKETNTFILELLCVNEETTVSDQLQLAIDESQAYKLDSRLTKLLIDLRDCIPDESQELKVWRSWNERLRRVMLDELNVNHSSQFSGTELEEFSDFLYANSLLLKCIMGYNISSHDLRDQIVDSMLLLPEHITEPVLSL
ncbi:MAG: NACHT domain-containing protein [Pseudanabaenaceae cyanobacterium bins.39]|nr:NACHT domain-containing protein [Pseudanabaenaceae cyanobacterium bins.39]